MHLEMRPCSRPLKIRAGLLFDMLSKRVLGPGISKADIEVEKILVGSKVRATGKLMDRKPGGGGMKQI